MYVCVCVRVSFSLSLTRARVSEIYIYIYIYISLTRARTQEISRVMADIFLLILFIHFLYKFLIRFDIC